MVHSRERGGTYLGPRQRSRRNIAIVRANDRGLLRNIALRARIRCSPGAKCVRPLRKRARCHFALMVRFLRLSSAPLARSSKSFRSIAGRAFRKINFCVSIFRRGRPQGYNKANFMLGFRASIKNLGNYRAHRAGR